MPELYPTGSAIALFVGVVGNFIPLPPEIVSMATGFGSGLAVLWIGKDYIKSRDALYATVLTKLTEATHVNTVAINKLSNHIDSLLSESNKPS